VTFAARRSTAGTSLVSVVLIIWLLIGVVAAGQRHYFSGSAKSCSKASTIVVTILAGPLNYLGVNPKVSCKVPQPSS
jgi:membrane protein YdbS with pleckstrin-like domain